MLRTATISACCFVFVTIGRAAADDWPQWRGPQRDGVWRETGLIEQFTTEEIEVKWRAPISSGYSGPTVADGRVFVTDRVVQPTQIERIHCFDWKTGTPIWTHSYDCAYEGFGYTAGPRASVLIDGELTYSLGGAGHLTCCYAEDGQVAWQHDLGTTYKIRMPNWGIAASPIIERDLVIVHIGGEAACVVAFDKRSGKERWKALTDDASYSAPIVIDQADKRVLVCWTGDRIVGLDPRTGKEYWAYDFKWEKWPIGIATPVLHGNLLLISESHKGSLLLRLAEDEPTVTRVWHRRKEEIENGAALHCLISTPQIVGSHVYGADSRGVLRCLELETGKQIWSDASAVPEDRWATIHLVRNGDLTWMFNERGELIIARLTPGGFDELSRARLLEPTTDQLRRRGGVTWSHPAFAYKHIFARNDEELVCADLSAQ